jgi:hypothetical protein
MKSLLPLLLVPLACLASLAAETPFYGVKDPHMGLYEGQWKAGRESGKLTVQLRPLGDGSYDGFALLRLGTNLHGVARLSGKPGEKDSLRLSSTSWTGSSAKTLQEVQWEGEIRKGRLQASAKGATGSLKGKRATRKSPTLGAKPPKGALVVFDGTDRGLFRQFTWDIVGGAMQVKKGDLVARERLTDFQLHIEFRTPYMPKARGQARGNSGVYLQSIYEVQVLDSFGLYPLAQNDCGSIYAIKAASGNHCLPPMEWQTYDIILRNGGPGQTPEITVRHNGVVTIENARVPSGIIGKGGGGGTPDGGFLKLQDHGNPVQFRNIWVLPLK